ncbi:MAG TPA: hypothetical protein VE996_09745 [Terriglobales bacterium]|nr:hypothetical protein [Terriglobales bacterium]
MKLRHVRILAAAVCLAAACLLPAALRGQEKAQPADNPSAREAWFLRGRRSPDSLPAAAHLWRALAMRARVALAPRAAARATAQPGVTGFTPTGSGAWTELGPRPLNTTPDALVPTTYGNVSGRVTAIALDPSDATGNTIYIGAAFGGLWKCTSALGASPTCTPLTDSQPTLAVGAIAVDPSNPAHLLVGTGEPNGSGDSYYGQGLLESTDGGATWTSITTADSGAESFVGQGFSRILFDPATPSVVLATTSSDVCCEAGAAAGPTGLYRSTDSGKTWSLVLQANDTDLIYDATAKTYYAAAGNVGIFKSANQGASWTILASPFVGASPAGDFSRASLAARNGTLYALLSDATGGPATPTPCTGGSTNCDTGLAESTDGGTTWHPLPMPDVSTAPGGGFTNLYCESGGGVTSCQGDYDQDIAAPAGGSGLLVGGIDLWSAASVPAMTTTGLSTAWTDITDGYASGANLVHPDQHAIAIFNATTWFIGNDGGAWATTNGGTSWMNLNATLGNIQFQSASPDSQKSGAWFGGAQDNGTSVNSGPGLAWSQFFGGDGGFTASDPTAPSDYWLEYPNGADIMMYDTSTGALAQAADNTVIPESGMFYVPYTLIPGSGTTPSQLLVGVCNMWLGPANPNNPGSLVWTKVTNFGCATTPITAVAADPNNANIAWFATLNGGLEMTSNLMSGSPTWTSMTAPLNMSGGPISSVAINPVDPSVVYLGVQGFGGGHVFKTTDGGATWTDITGNLPDAPVNWILIDPLGPNNDIYVASDVGVFAATDGGAANEQWMQVGGGLPDAAVLQLSISPKTWSSRQLVAATHGRGLWEIAPLPTPSFTLAASPTTLSVAAGTAASFTVTASGANGETATIAYSCAAPASGCSISPATAAPGTPVTVTIAGSAIALGTTTVSIAATDQISTQTLSVTITGLPFTLATTPATVTALAGAGAQFSVTAQAGSGFTGTIALTCTAPASGCSVSPASISGGGSATVTVAAAGLSDGANTVTVSGAANGATETASAQVTVQDFSIALAPPANPVVAGNQATLALSSSGIAGFGGTLSLSCAAPASGCTASPASITAGGAATVTVAAAALQPGANTITVNASSGGLSHAASGTVTVEDFSLAAASSSASITPGQSATYNLTLTAESGFNGAVAVSCSGAPAEAACSVSPASVTPTASGTAATVTVTTTAPGALAPWNSPDSRWPPLIFLALALAALGMAVRPRRHRAWKRRLAWTALVGALLLAGGCGGGSSSSSAPPPNPGTPAGTYTLTVTGTSGADSHSASLSLTVQ